MKGKASRRTAAAAVLGAAMALAAPPAEAASAQCRQLRAELAAMPSRGKPRLLAKYDDAIARQRQEIEKVRGQARRAGCFLGIFGSARSQCSLLDTSLKRMHANLAGLENKRAGLANGGLPRERQRLLARLEANGCKERQARARTAPHAAADSPATGGGGEAGRSRRMRSQPGSDTIIQILEPPQAVGQYRTMCVRTCDGYFFPMSNAATLADFERDRKNCESSCPGTEMQVFYSRGMGTDSADMISVADGRPYSELATAHLYKRTDVTVAQCGCRAAGRDFSVIGGAIAPARPQGHAVSSSIVAFPAPKVPKPAPAQGAGAIVPQAGEVPLDEDRRNVRVVGPRFLPDPSEAIDLQAPALTNAP